MEFPISFLIASHIKNRSFCKNEKKPDYKNILVPMCKFGCDDLFEKGYISVINGKIKVNKKRVTDLLET
ncbi:hypothetical protein J22TS1_21630 [Siminovitchia terrae]|nr:hypothetical protein J22TS1_21630 [Siminovitchia terrae]